MPQRYIVGQMPLPYCGNTYTVPNMPIFFSGAEFQVLKTMGRELVENLIKEQIELYRVDTENTESNFYGESKNKNWIGPTIVTCRVERTDRDVFLEGGLRRQRRREITVYVYQDHLKDIGIDEIRIGDFFKHRNDFYEVYGNVGQGTRMGVDRGYYRRYRAFYVEEDVFSGR